MDSMRERVLGARKMYNCTAVLHPYYGTSKAVPLMLPLCNMQYTPTAVNAFV